MTCLASANGSADVTLLYGAATPERVLYAREYSRLVAAAESTLQTTVDRSVPRWAGNVGVVPLLLDRLRRSTRRDRWCSPAGPK